MIVLHKMSGKTRLGKITGLEAFHEKAAVVFEYARLYDNHAGQWSLGNGDQAVWPKYAAKETARITDCLPARRTNRVLRTLLGARGRADAGAIRKL